MPKPGLQYFAYVNSNTFAAPTWLELSLARDVDFNLKPEKADSRARISSLATILIAHIAHDFTLDMLHEPALASQVLLQARALAGTDVELAFLNGSIVIAGSVGFRCTYKITDYSNPQKMGDVSTITMSGEPAYGASLVALTIQ